MISQADIIRTLVNQNCTDESIISTALSPDCTPPRLLEKFTEAERFDLALDVSMKLGWDVLPIWKTWGLRCLKNRNYQGARDKFRHCFQRIRSQNGRSNLLSDILKVLIRLDENQATLSEEIESIRNRTSVRGKENSSYSNYSNEPKNVKLNETKPAVYAECMHYLKEYASLEQSIRFHVCNHLWEQAIKMLLDHRNCVTPHKFFINEVVLYSTKTGHLNNVVITLKNNDPEFVKSIEYFKAIYKYYTDNKRHNTLYYVQNEIGDHVAAAENQIVNFFLKKPILSYRELNQRLSSLICARDNYKQHLIKLEHCSSQISDAQDETNSEQSKLITYISRDETNARLHTINTQIEITRNFALNEVQGCMNDVEVVINPSSQTSSPSDNELDKLTSPVTLFHRSEKSRVFLAALVMIYYDLEYNTYFSDSGMELAYRMIDEFGLDKVQVFKTAMRVILDDESSDLVVNANLLLERLQADYLACTKRNKAKSTIKTPRDSNAVISQPIPKTIDEKTPHKSTQMMQSKKTSYTFIPKDKNVQPGTIRAARLLCDDVIRDSIRVCREPDYKMELSKLLSPEARIELNMELGKLSIAQRLAFDMNRPDYVMMVLKEAERLNQDHVKDVCQHWLAKH